MIAKKGERVNEIFFEVCGLSRTRVGDAIEFERLIKVAANYEVSSRFRSARPPMVFSTGIDLKERSHAA